MLADSTHFNLQFKDSFKSYKEAKTYNMFLLQTVCLKSKH